MIKVLLIQDQITHYRINIFNDLSKRLKEKGFTLKVVASYINSSFVDKVKFDYEIVEKKLYFGKLKHIKVSACIKKYNPDVIIQQGELKFLNVYFFILSKYFTKRKIVFWSHGYHREGSNFLFQKVMRRADALLLYTKYVEPDYRDVINKVFFVNNSLYFSDEDILLRQSLIENKLSIKNKLHLSNKKIGLFCGRLYKEKKADVLVDLFRKLGNKYHLLIIGDGECYGALRDKIEKEKIHNVTLLGEITDVNKKAEYFAIADLGFSPGLIGLNIVDYFFWGIPLILLMGLEGKHGPEIYYFKDNKNGFYCKDLDDMCKKSELLFNDSVKLKEFSKAALSTYENEANHNAMLNGFVNCLEYISKKKDIKKRRK